MIVNARHIEMLFKINAIFVAELYETIEEHFFSVS